MARLIVTTIVTNNYSFRPVDNIEQMLPVSHQIEFAPSSHPGTHYKFLFRFRLHLQRIKERELNIFGVILLQN